MPYMLQTHMGTIYKQHRPQVHRLDTHAQAEFAGSTGMSHTELGGTWLCAHDKMTDGD